MNPGFDVPVPPGGYAWWYVDAWSADGRHGLVVIAFLGSVFSPYYALARRRAGGLADPLQHCAVNVALYRGPGQDAPTAWAMTERGRAQVRRCDTALAIGLSRLEWSAGVLRIAVDEVAAPWPRRLRGEIELRSPAWLPATYPLDAAGRHVWRPIAPSAQVSVRFERPALDWQGTGYLDTNRGERPLAADFERWDWLRAPLPGGGAAIVYDVQRSDASEHRIGLVVGPGGVQPLPPPPREAMPSTGWRLQRFAASEPAAAPDVLQTLEDGPFYARSVVRTRVAGRDVQAMHESLSLRRWRHPLVQAMLPFRMPRRA